MAYDKKPGSFGNRGNTGYKGNSGSKGNSGNRGGKSRSEEFFAKPGGEAGGKPAFGNKPQPHYAKFSGNGAKPERSYGSQDKGPGSQRKGYGAPQDRGNAPQGKPFGQQSKPFGQQSKPFGQQGKPFPPRRATPMGRPVPPATRVDERPSPVFEERDGFVREDDMPRDNILAGRNPIREAIKAGKPINKLLVQTGDLSGSARQIVAWAKEARVVVQFVEKTRLDQLYANHQGMIAFAAAAEYSTMEAILDYAKGKGEHPFVIVLDSITDPHNLGAIIRTAECAGAHGVIVTERRSALLSPAAVKAAAGACEYQRVARVVNLARALDELKAAGLWVIGADMAGEPAQGADLSGPMALVIGSEGEGISQLVAKKCDKMLALPIKGQIDSLNASVAAGILMYEVLRARG